MSCSTALSSSRYESTDALRPSTSNPKSFMAKSTTPFERSLHTTRKSTQDNQVTRQHLQQHEQGRATLAGSTDAPLREKSLCSLKIVSSRRVNFLRISTLLDVSWERSLFCTSWSRYRKFPYTFCLCVRQFSSCNVRSWTFHPATLQLGDP